MGIGTDNSKAFGMQNFCKPAHADAADSHKVNFDWFIEIDLIHQNPSYL